MKSLLSLQTKSFFCLPLLLLLAFADASKPESPMQFIFSVDAGFNVFAEDEEEFVRANNLEKMGSVVAVSYTLKAGLQFYNHYAVFLSYGYDKRPDYYYKLGSLVENLKYQESQKNYSLGVDFSYYFWPYLNTLNIAVSLGNRALMKAVRVTALTYNDEEQITSFVEPHSIITTHYLLAPQLKLHYRIVENNATLYFAFQYNLVFPEFEHYPSFLFGVDIHFGLSENKNASFQ